MHPQSSKIISESSVENNGFLCEIARLSLENANFSMGWLIW